MLEASGSQSLMNPRTTQGWLHEETGTQALPKSSKYENLEKEHEQAHVKKLCSDFFTPQS